MKLLLPRKLRNRLNDREAYNQKIADLVALMDIMTVDTIHPAIWPVVHETKQLWTQLFKPAFGKVPETALAAFTEGLTNMLAHSNKAKELTR